MSMAGCQKTGLADIASDGFIDATFAIGTIDGIDTRAIGDGTSVDKVVCAVYDAKGEELADLRQTLDIADKTATFSTCLAKGYNYRVAFFAYNEAAAAYDITDLKSIKVKDGQLSNVEGRDAFAAYYDVESDKTMYPIKEKVTLQRPFAQLNLGINAQEKQAAADAGVVVKKSKVIVSNVYKTFNAYDDVVVGEMEEMVFELNDIPEATFEINGVEYHYMAMNYLLVGDPDSEKSLTDIEFVYQTVDGVQNDPAAVFYNVPVQRNYRTNIYGKLLTSSLDVEIEVEPAFEDPAKDVHIATNEEDLKSMIQTGGNVRLGTDIALDSRLDIPAGADVHLDLNGQKITVDEDSNADYVFIVREGANLVIDGDGTVETSTPAPVLFYPAGNVVIESGTFIRNIPEGYDGAVRGMFTGTKPEGGWESTGVTINGGYFDSGYYDAYAADVEDILAGTKTLVETDDDIAKRGAPGDKNLIRIALKNNVNVMFNRSNNYFKVYGGTFVGANPAWGDEGCMLPVTPYYLRPWSYYQGAFLDGQTAHDDGIVLPEGYTITKGTHEDGRPTYTVTYSN